MKPRAIQHAITPTDAGPDWRYSPPSAWFRMRCADGVVRECINLDAYHAVTLPAQHQAAVDARAARGRK